jgi:hypothetical protein
MFREPLINVADALRTSAMTRLIRIGACTAALLAVAASTAQAADHDMYSKDDVFPGESPGAHMWFNEHGDVVTLCDNDADGMKATLTVAYGSAYHPPAKYTMSVGGDGRCTTRKARLGRRFNLAENRRVGFLICVQNPGQQPQLCNANSWVNDH